MKQSFQDGVNTIYNKIVSCGVTPYDRTPTGCANGIQSIYTNRYNEGYNNGRAQGQNDVKNNPNNYGLYSKSQYDQNYNNGRTQGQQDVKNNPNGYGLYTQQQYDQNYTNGYNAGYDASAIGGFLGAEYQLQGSRDVVASFSKYSGIVVICISLGWQYNIGGNLNLSITPNNYELIYKDTDDMTGGNRFGGYIYRIVIKTNLDSVPNKQFTINEDGLNNTIKYYNALVFRAS